MDMTAFSHGQAQSKLWLCEQLEPLVPENTQALILGSWYNLLGFMLLSRHPEKYISITGIDKNPEAIDIADKLNNGWMIANDKKIKNICNDVNSLNSTDFSPYNLIINTSCEHMNVDWYDRIVSDQLLCLQTCNLVTSDPNWNIINPSPTMNDFKSKYPMSQILFEGMKVFDYGHLVYTRYMLIGRK